MSLTATQPAPALGVRAVVRPSSPPVDATVAMDDQLCERFRRCLLCGRAASLMNCALINAVGYLECLCDPCYRQHGWAAVDRLLIQRLEAARSMSFRMHPARSRSREHAPLYANLQ